VRRIAAIKAALGQRLHILVGVDDLIVEGIAAGATGWVAGLVNAFPHESIALFKLARAHRWAEAEPLYHWFLPLLRMDVVPKFVQLIKLVQSRVGMGRATVRAPRLMLVGDELEQANAIITQALASKPAVPAC
jgi:4-hydroxy-tetrahydrodipicolinate synthase